MASIPKTRPEFWQAKFDANVARDDAATKKLLGAGWRVATIWECETKDPVMVERILRAAVTYE